MDQNLNPRFVHIVAPSVAVVDAQAGLQIAQQVVRFDERIDFGRDHRCAAHAAADKNPGTQFTILTNKFEPDVV